MIIVCQEWKNSFQDFYKWAIASSYRKSLTIDRRNNDGNYCPENCRFVTMIENRRNSPLAKLNIEKVRKIKILIKEGKLTQGRIGEMFGIIPHKLPVPMCNVINGGKHAGQENSIQEHMLMPTGAKSFSEGIRMVSESYHHLAKLLKEKFGAGGALIGDEGGFAPAQMTVVDDRLDLMLKAVENAGYDGMMKIAMDPASSEFFYDGTYKIGAKSFSGGEMVDFYVDLCKKYPIVSIEDGHAEDDWESWVEMVKKLGTKVQIVGDDLFVTNTKRIQKGIDLGAANSVLIKLNQIGSVTETLNAIKMAHDQGWTAVVSHRSGETEDSFIADLVVGTSAGQIKTGAPARSDRNAKYNQLLRIEEELDDEAEYPGIDFRLDYLA